jgi:arylformamidase
MEEMIQISYPLTAKSPLYPGTPPLSIKYVKDFGYGDTSRSSIISFSSHAGTHLDMPSHVCPDRANDDGFRWDFRIDLYPCRCVDVKKSGDEPVNLNDIPQVISSDITIQALFIRTGMWEMREKDPEGYSVHHPWLHPDCVLTLRERYPSLKLLGVDLVSITNPLFRDYGRESHRLLLCGDSPVLILEDLNLSPNLLLQGDFHLVIAPIVHESLDGMPVFCFIY